MARRGQAEPITVMILVSATLVVALLLYAYFTGLYAGQQKTISLVDVLATYASGLVVRQESGLVYQDPDTGDYAYCYVVSIANGIGDPLRAYFTLLPGVPGGNGIITVNEYYLYVPVLYLGTAPVERSLHAWIVEDIDNDGVVEAVGQDPATGNLTIAFERIPSCRDLYANRTDLNALKPLLLPPEADDPTYGFQATKIMLSPNGPSLQEALNITIANPPNALVPAWNVTVPPRGKVSLLFSTYSPVELTQQSIVGLVQYEGKLYVFVTVPVGPFQLGLQP